MSDRMSKLSVATAISRYSVVMESGVHRNSSAANSSDCEKAVLLGSFVESPPQLMQKCEF